MDVIEARAVIGVGPMTPWGDVRRAYLRLVREHHPDGAADLADAGRRTLATAEITRAYSVLLSARDRPPVPPRSPGRPRVVVSEPDTRTVLLDANLADAFQALLEVGHLVGDVSYVDRSSAVLEVIVTARPGEATSLLALLEPRDEVTEAVLGVEPLGGHPPAPLDALVERIAELLARPRPPAPRAAGG